MKKIICTILSAVALSCVAAVAQPGGFGGGFPGGFGGGFPGGFGGGFGMPRQQTMSAQELRDKAQQRADEMKAEIGLTDKQYKKIVKYYETEVKKEATMPKPKPQLPEGAAAEGERPQRGERQGGFPGGGFPGGGDFGGFPGGFGGFGGGMPMGGSYQREMTEEQIEKFYNKQDGKLKKILAPEQHASWRAKHPVVPERKAPVVDPSSIPAQFQGRGQFQGQGQFPGQGQAPGFNR